MFHFRPIASTGVQNRNIGHIGQNTCFPKQTVVQWYQKLRILPKNPKMQNHRSSNAPEIGEASRPNASGIVNRSVAKVALALAVILAGDPAYALLPKEATGGGDFSENGVQFCNFSRVKIGKGE
jgi:hypothetical protein